MNSSRKHGLVAVAVLVVGGLASGASALTNHTVIYDNGGPDITQGAPLSDFDGSAQRADDFVLPPGHATITDVHWWGIYGLRDFVLDGPDDFTIRIFEDDNGLPATDWIHEFDVGAVNRTDTGLDFGNSDVYEYWTFVPATQLTAGDTYWLSVVNDTVVDDNDFWFMNASTQQTGSTYHSRDTDSSVWGSPSNNDLAFNITGPNSIPEPITAALGLMGLGSLGLATRRRRMV